MKLEIKLFATLRDLAGSRTASLHLDEPATVNSLLAAMAEQYPAVSSTLPIALVSVNKQFAEGETAVSILQQQAKPTDTILIKGSWGMRLDRIVAAFADRA